MADRILKDIRIYESNVNNVTGNSHPSDLGNIFKSTENTNFIAKRIARKLNELKYSLGEPDHIYINLSTFLNENTIEVSNRETEKWMKYIDFGVSPEYFNSLKNEEKDDFIEKTILKIFQFISNEQNLKLVTQTATELSKFGRKIKIHYKTKETKSYRIDIYYQIAPLNKISNAIIEYHNKKNNTSKIKTFELRLYDDIYSLIGNVVVKGNKITLKPKKSYSAELVTKNYETPIEFDLS